MNRFESEFVLRGATGGSSPRVGDTLVFLESGWKFIRNPYLGAVEEDPINPEDGEFWFNTTEGKMRIQTAAGVLETAAWTPL